MIDRRNARKVLLGLKCCASVDESLCKECPFAGTDCASNCMTAASQLIRQLLVENRELTKDMQDLSHLVEQLDAVSQRLRAAMEGCKEN